MRELADVAPFSALLVPSVLFLNWHELFALENVLQDRKQGWEHRVKWIGVLWWQVHLQSALVALGVVDTSPPSNGHAMVGECPKTCELHGWKAHQP